jgi:hypothetical protein
MRLDVRHIATTTGGDVTIDPGLNNCTPTINMTISWKWTIIYKK